MGIKRKIEDQVDPSEKKTKSNATFPLETFVKNLKDPESSFLALTEFNEYVRHLTSEEQIDRLMNDSLQALKSNIDDILSLITEEKRKASENITLYRFLSTLLDHLSRKTDAILSDLILKKFISISNSIYTIYFMLSSQSTASHLKITIRFLLSLVQQNEFSCRSIFSLIDFKRPCWKSLLKRRDVRDPEDVRYWTIKFFLSPLVYQHVDSIRNLIKEQDIFREIFNGLVQDSRQSVQFILEELKTNVLMVHGLNKTDKLHLFDDRNLKGLSRLYHWTGEKRQKDLKKLNKKKKKQDLLSLDEEDNDDEMDVDENEDRSEIRRLIHQFLIILFNSKNYGIQFFDFQFGTSNKNANPILFKLIQHLSQHVHQDEYINNFIVTSLSTCPDLLQPYFQYIANEHLSSRSKNLFETFEFLCEIVEQQKPIETWSNIFENVTDSTKLADIFIHLTIPMEILTKFDQIVWKNSEMKIQLISMKFLSLILNRIQNVLTFLQNEKLNAIESFQQAILRFVPKADHFCDSLNSMKTIDLSDDDRNRFIDEYLNLLIRYSSSSFMSISSLNIHFDVLLSNSIVQLLSFFKENQMKNFPLIDKYFQCLTNIFRYRDSIDDAVWARQNKDLGSTPIRMLLKLSKNFTEIDRICTSLTSIITKISSLLQNEDELILWFYIWLKFGGEEIIEEFLSNCLEKIILNPYPLVDKCEKYDASSLLLLAALESNRNEKKIEEFLSDVFFWIFIVHSNRSAFEKNLLDFQRNFLSTGFDRISEEKLQRFERFLLIKIENEKRFDRIQIDLTIKLNLFKIFSLKNSSKTLVDEIIEILNMVLLVDDDQRSFIDLFDKTIENLQNYSNENDQMNFICRIVEGLDRTRQTNKQKSKNSQILLRYFEKNPTNEFLINFLANYLSVEFRNEFLNLICENFRIDVKILRIFIEEIRSNSQLVDRRYFEMIFDHLKFCDETNLIDSIEILFVLIERMKKIKEKFWKNFLRSKQKFVWKFVSKVSPLNSISKFIFQTFVILKSADRPLAIEFLVKKSLRSPILLTNVFLQLFRDEQKFDIESLFDEFLPELIRNYSKETIVFEFFQLFNEKFPEEKQRIVEIFKREESPNEQTNRLFLLIRIFPDEISTAEQIYRSLIEKQTFLVETNDFEVFNRCSTFFLLEKRISPSVDHYALISMIFKSFSTLTKENLQLIKIFLQSFLLEANFDRKILAKLFARLLKHSNFLDSLSSTENRTILVDLLGLFVSNYNAELTSVTIDCSKHFPMLLTIYQPTLSQHDQHTLACLYQYEKSGFLMESAFVWGETALKHFRSTTDSKSILYQTSKLDEVMNLLDDRMMIKSIQYFPVTRRLRNIEPNVYDQGDQIYDPAYLIPLFFHLLGSENLVKCQQFIEKHCLAYCLMALSSRCGLLRAVVYNCLTRFEQHLHAQRFFCKEQIVTMLTLLKQSIKKSNLKLAPIVAFFLSKLADLFTHPESKIYRTITRFLLKQPYIDLVHIPLFGELFHSSSIDYKYERNWILNLLKYGIKDIIDYTLCSKAYVFKTLMAFYDCSLCDETTKLDILRVFYATVKLQEILLSLLFDYGFLLWLQRILPHSSTESLPILTPILENIGTRLLNVENQVFILEFDGVMMLFLRRVKSETSFLSTMMDTITSIVTKHQICLKSLKSGWKSSVDVQQLKSDVVFS